MNTSDRPQSKGRTGKRKRLALCLSGGGFRAALFHLGALRRLNETGVLSAVDTISSVSGGSILAAHLAQCIGHWPENGAVLADWERKVVQPFQEFVCRDLRSLPLAQRFLLPWNWPRLHIQVQSLERAYARRLTNKTLGELPERPQYIFCATNLLFGVNWRFEREVAGDYQSGYFTPGRQWSLARAVAASTCCPPFFDPMHIDVSSETLRGGKYPRREFRRLSARGIQLSDGGVYDNLGLEPVWKTHDTVLVSDGGTPFAFTPSRTFFARSLRYLGIAGNQTAALRKRIFYTSITQAKIRGAYWSIGRRGESRGNERAFYYPAEIVSLIAGIRTDMDPFGSAECEILENHGYCAAERAVRERLPEVLAQGAPFRLPNERWRDIHKVRAALRHSDKRFHHTRYFSFRGGLD